ncbi:MAG: hypothetical protein AAF626_02950 [Pseudomonadota bacterium]
MRSVLAGLALTTGAATADPFADVAPCMTALPTEEAYKEALLALGWAEPEGALLERASRAAGELAIVSMAAILETRADVLTFAQRAREEAEILISNGTLLMTKGEHNLWLYFSTAKDLPRVGCALTGKSLAIVRDAIPERPENLTYGFVDVPSGHPVDGISALRVNAVRVFYPLFTGPLTAGGDALIVTADLSAPFAGGAGE